jgi:glycerol-3-phosphate dehydrogenase (NAD(P)+)
MNTQTVSVIGEGAWGTAFATLLAHNGHTVNLWCYHPEIAHDIQSVRTNRRYMPHVTLSPRIHATDDIKTAVTTADIIFIAIPVQHLRSVCINIAPHLHSAHTLVSLSKGIEKDTLMFPTDIMDDTIRSVAQKAVIAGPSFAHDIIKQQPTGLIVASESAPCAALLADMIRNTFCTISISSDMRGVQLCSAIKNVVALGAGILDGAGYTDNTKALFMTRCMRELQVLLAASGGKQETIYGLAGIGDMMLTAYGTHGRNLSVGRKLGRGETLSAILATTGYTPEGINTVLSVQKLADRVGVALPLCQAIHDVIYKEMPIRDMIKILCTN